MKFISLFLCAMVSVFILDMLWLGLIAKNIYAQNIGILLRKSNELMAPIWWAAAIVYVCIALGIVFFVIPKAHGNYFHALIWGAVLGLVTYGIYDFTNYSILTNWPLKITLIDFVWGMILCGFASFIVVLIENQFFTWII